MILPCQRSCHFDSDDEDLEEAFFPLQLSRRESLEDGPPPVPPSPDEEACGEPLVVHTEYLTDENIHMIGAVKIYF